ncbi:MAG: hypothetical protein ACM3L9_11415 [Deltaproteobacteria bacterium]
MIRIHSFAGIRSFGRALTLAAAANLPVVAHAGESAPAAANPAPAITVELNKLETVDKGCRVYTVVDNPSPTTFQTLKLDLILFHTDGVIGRRLALDLAPLKGQKKTVKMFDLEGTPCDKIGSFLVHDIMECKSEAGALDKCLDAITLKSLSNVQITK